MNAFPGHDPAATAGGTYTEARARFLSSAAAAGAAISSIDHPLPGPAGQALATDLAWLGPADAEAVLLIASGAHGVEGHCGSMVQTAWLRTTSRDSLPDGVAVALLHAINPFGFAWTRRTDHENIDINRNWVDFARPLPVNAAYLAHEALVVPAHWDGPARAAFRAVLEDAASGSDRRALIAALTSGQHDRPDGLFFGGRTASWSRTMLEDLLPRAFRVCGQLAIIDIHSGLGPFGHGERMIPAGAGPVARARAGRWYGLGVTVVGGEDSASAAVTGDWMSGAARLLPEVAVTPVAMEFGTRPVVQVLEALVGDAWLWRDRPGRADHAAEVMAATRDAFFPADPVWQGMILGQALAMIGQALEGLSHDLSENIA